MKTDDTYMKLSWLTVTEDSMDKQYRCIVKHENNQRGVDKEILFPPIDKVVNTVTPTEAYLTTENAFTTIDINSRENVMRCENDMLQHQVTNTSAFYAYLILFLKSALYLAFVTFSLLRRAVPCDGQRS